MFDFRLLQEGYCIETANQMNVFRASCSVSLLTKHEMTILIDTGSPWDANHILKSLHEINLHPNDINYVVCTHGHLDHVGLLSHFTNSKIILGADMGMATNCYSDDYSVKTTDFKAS